MTILSKPYCIKPRSLDGTDDVNNLALACSRCNQRRYNFTVASDLETQSEVALFNPRSQQWQEHFIWTREGTKIIGVTAIGRATCDRLDMNDDRYQGVRSIQEARGLWIKSGCHPPILRTVFKQPKYHKTRRKEG